MNKSRRWTTWPAWVFYAWYWWPHAWPRLYGEEDEAVVRFVVEMVRKKAVGQED